MSLIFENIIENKAIQLLISCIISFAITMRAIPVIINICNLTNLMETANKRSSHAEPTPTFGGVAIFSSTLIAYMIWNFGDEGFLLHKTIAGMVILFFLGIKDDLYSLDALKKLGSQILVASLVVIGSDLRITSFFGIFGVYELPYLVSVAFTICLIVTIINSFNLIDGVDGLAGGIGMIACAGFALWFALNEKWSLACLGFSMAASLFGFLRFNYSTKRKIFMGDTGSLIIGYITSILAIQFVQSNVFNLNRESVYKNAPVIALVLLCVPIFDTVRVFALRIIRGRSPFKADRVHLHHLMIDNGLSHVATSFILYCFTIVSTSVTYLLRTFFTNTQLSIGILGYFIFYVVICHLLEIRRLKNHKSKLEYNEELELERIKISSNPFNPN